MVRPLPKTRSPPNRDVLHNPALDQCDKAILRILQNEGRLTYADLAQRVGITPSPCRRRVRRLENEGYILGYRVNVNAVGLGFAVTGFISVGLVSQRQNDINAFERHVKDWPTVRECYALNGTTDFVLKCVTRDLTDFQRFVTETLMRTPNVKSVISSLVIRTSKELTGIP
jgi:DNA-binding Lrp family transcriptional regulator